MKPKDHKVCVIGAGAGGLAAAHRLMDAGFRVDILEGSAQVGGLAGGYHDPNWEWSLEKFYHHWFQSDDHILGLMQDIGVRDKAFFPRPLSAFWDIESRRADVFDSPLSVLKYPHLSLRQKIRMGLVVTYLRKTTNWKALEGVTAEFWLERWMGVESYQKLWRPMLIGKFGEDYKNVTMAWFWARIHARTPRLGYFEGGFQTFFDILAKHLQKRGAGLSLNQRVTSIRKAKAGGLEVSAGETSKNYDAVISTTSPSLMAALATELPTDYLQRLTKMKSLAAVVAVLALKKPMFKDVYWLNLPVSGDSKDSSALPFLALVEHTNFIDRKHYGGDHLIYCGDYLPADHPHMDMDEDKLLDKFISVMPQFNPEFDRSWIRKTWLTRSAYAQPVPEIGHSRNIPDIRTPLRGLYFASMSQVYPWDRGTNFAVEIGQRAAGMVSDDFAKRKSNG